MALARAIGIEVAEQYDIESEAEVIGGQAGLHRQLGCAVWIERDRGVVLQDRQPLRHAVDRRRGGEDDLLHAGGPHRLSQPDAIDDIVLGEQERVGDRFADLDKRGHVDDCVVAGKGLGQGLDVGQVSAN